MMAESENSIVAQGRTFARLVLLPLRRLRRYVMNSTARVNHRPIIILGNQKSGTTAIASLLAQATDKSVTLDLSERWLPWHWARDIHAGRLSFQALVMQARLEFSRDIVKEPALTHMYSYLEECFPNAQYVLIVRDPRDNIRSILDRVDLPGTPTRFDAQQLTSLKPGWRKVLDGTRLGFRRDRWPDNLSEKWNHCADIHLENPEEVLLLKYEDFQADKCAQIALLAARLGLPVTQDVSETVDIQYQPRGRRRSMPWIDFFGAENLSRIERICCERMRKLG